MAEQYEMLEELGSGSFGVVYKALERATGELVAIKHIDLDGTDDDIRDIQQEIALLSTCKSPYVTRYKTSFVRGVKLWIVMEYLGGGSCLDLAKIKPFDEAHAAIVCRELLLGLDYLHQSGKIHRDIKAANILLSHAGRVKIADFGVAAQLTNIKSQRMTFVGTPFWMAPEVIQEAGYDFKADIWSLGITAIELVKAEPPNADQHPMKALFQIPKQPPPQLEGRYSTSFKDFVKCCLVKDPEHRPTAKDLLQHRFIQRAGRVDALREIVDLRKQHDAHEKEDSRLRYYEETLRDMSPSKEDDEWVFDTVKPAKAALPQPTMKKRKLSTSKPDSQKPPTELFSQMDLNENGTNPFSRPQSDIIQFYPAKLATPTELEATATIQRRQSLVASPRRVSNPISVASNVQRQPLAVDMSFGNSTSTMRQFRRVSDESPVTSIAPQLPASNENVPPPAEAATKEAKLGRRAFSRIIDPAFQEICAQTADKSKQEAMSKVAQAWSVLDAMDPEGEYLLVKSILERAMSDPKLTATLSPSSNPSTPQKPKLVLAQSNPHLKSHRRRQSSQILGFDVTEKLSSLPGQSHPGMEHTKQLADVLYSRWIDGLRSRWPAT